MDSSLHRSLPLDAGRRCSKQLDALEPEAALEAEAAVQTVCTDSSTPSSVFLKVNETKLVYDGGRFGLHPLQVVGGQVVRQLATRLASQGSTASFRPGQLNRWLHRRSRGI